MRGFDRSISPLPSPLLVFPHIARESVSSSQVPMDIICCYPGYGGLGEPAARPPTGFRSQVVVSSLPPCSLSLLRWGAEAGAVPARSPVPSLPGKTGLLVPNAAQAAPLQFSLCRWCSFLCSLNETFVQGPHRQCPVISTVRIGSCPNLPVCNLLGFEMSFKKMFVFCCFLFF